MNSGFKDTRIDDRVLPRTSSISNSTSTITPHLGIVPRLHANGATSASSRTTPGPQDLVPAKRRRSTTGSGAPAIKRSVSSAGRGGRTMLSFCLPLVGGASSLSRTHAAGTQLASSISQQQQHQQQQQRKFRLISPATASSERLSAASLALDPSTTVIEGDSGRSRRSISPPIPAAPPTSVSNPIFIDDSDDEPAGSRHGVDGGRHNTGGGEDIPAVPKRMSIGAKPRVIHIDISSDDDEPTEIVVPSKQAPLLSSKRALSPLPAISLASPSVAGATIRPSCKSQTPMSQVIDPTRGSAAGAVGGQIGGADNVVVVRDQGPQPQHQHQQQPLLSGHSQRATTTRSNIESTIRATDRHSRSNVDLIRNLEQNIQQQQQHQHHAQTVKTTGQQVYVDDSTEEEDNSQVSISDRRHIHPSSSTVPASTFSTTRDTALSAPPAPTSKLQPIAAADTASIRAIHTPTLYASHRQPSASFSSTSSTQPSDSSDWSTVGNWRVNIKTVHNTANQAVGRTTATSTRTPSSLSSSSTPSNDNNNSRNNNRQSPLLSNTPPQRAGFTKPGMARVLPGPESPQAKTTETTIPVIELSPSPPSNILENSSSEDVIYEYDFEQERPSSSSSLSSSYPFFEQSQEQHHVHESTPALNMDREATPRRESIGSKGSDIDYQYDDDHLIGGSLEIPALKTNKMQDVNYSRAIQQSYTKSLGQLLRYQQGIRKENTGWQNTEYKLRQTYSSAEENTTIDPEQMKVIVEQVEEATNLLKKADWEMIARITTVRHGKEVTGSECKVAFEQRFSRRRTKEASLWKASKVIPFVNASNLNSLLATRRLGTRSYHPGHVHDLICQRQAKTSYRHATSFNYGSGSVVDMAMKRDGNRFEVLVASIATPDAYNRQGNLLLCDFMTGITKSLSGHEVWNAERQEHVSRTVNDVKLSYSKEYFISVAEDESSKVWKTGTGELIATQNDLDRPVSLVAVCEASLMHEDVFATCSDTGGVMVYAMDMHEPRVSRQSSLVQQSAQRCVTAIQFGQGYYWNILAVGMEGIQGQGQGLITLYDANLERVSTRISLYRQTGWSPAASVSSLSFSSSGELLLCGTAGGNTPDDHVGDGLLRLYDVKTGKPIVEVVTDQEDVNIVGFSPCETYMISCSAKNDIVVFDRRFMRPDPAASTTTASLFTRITVGANGFPTSAIGRRRAAGLTRATTRREVCPPPVRRPDIKPLHSFYHESTDEVPTSGISSALWWPSGPPSAGRFQEVFFEGYRSSHGSMQWLVTGGGDGVVRAWDIARATEDAKVWSLEARVGPITRVVATPDFDDMVVGGETGMVSLYTMNEGLVSQYDRETMRLLQREE